MKRAFWVVLLLLPIAVNAENKDSSSSTPDNDVDAPSSVLSNVGSLADNAQRVTTDRFNRFVLSIDDFFGGAESSGEANRSWGRIRFDGIDPDNDEFELKTRLKLRVVLPQAERKLRLLFSNEDNDVNSGRRGIETDVNEQDVAFALRFVRTLSDKLSLNFDLGARVRDRKGQIFGRISASNVSKLGWGIEQQISNNFFLFSASGYQNRFIYDIRRPLKDSTSVFLRSSTTFEAQKGISGMAINETLGLYADLSSRTAVAFEGLFSFVTSEDDEYDTFYLGSEFRVRFRQNIGRPWFFYEIWPTVSFPASSNYAREYGGRIRIEMLFGQY